MFLFNNINFILSLQSLVWDKRDTKMFVMKCDPPGNHISGMLGCIQYHSSWMEDRCTFTSKNSQSTIESDIYIPFEESARVENQSNIYQNFPSQNSPTLLTAFESGLIVCHDLRIGR